MGLAGRQPTKSVTVRPPCAFSLEMAQGFATAQPTAAPSGICQAEQIRRRYFEGATDCYWHPALEIREQSGGDRTVITTRPIDAGETLVILGPDRNLTASAARAASSWDLSGLDDDLIIAALLCQLFASPKADLLHRLPPGFDCYVQALPSHAWYERHHAALALARAAGDQHRAALNNHLPLLAAITSLRDWLIQSGRSEIPAEVYERAVLCSSTRTWADSGLVPFIDFFNHKPGGSLLSASDCRIAATVHYPSGSQVHTSYGPKDALTLLSNYGFTGADTAVGLSRLDASRWALACDEGLNDYSASAQGMPFLLEHDLSNLDQLIHGARLWALDRHDIPFIGQPWSDAHGLITAANEQRALSRLLAGLRHQQRTLRQRLDLLQQVAPHQAAAPWQAVINRHLGTLERASIRIKAQWSDLLPDPLQPESNAKQ